MSLGVQLTLTAANIVAGKYIYTRDLQSLDLCRPSQSPGRYLSAANPSPLRWPAWCRVLELHPDQAFASYLAQGLQEGFRIGFNYEKSCSPAWRNMISARENPAVVREYIVEECQLGRLVPVPIETLTTASVQLSPFGVIPKRGQPGRWRLIVNLSSPEGASVNDGIDSLLTSLHYASVDDAVSTIQALGAGTMMAKLDLKAAYRNVSVHPADRPLLGMLWDNTVLIDTALPFGLRSAPKIFSAIADGVLWAMWLNGVRHLIHYLDDFMFFGQPHSLECGEALDIGLRTCAELGFTAHKIAGPATCITFLGIEIDSAMSQLRLPADKLLSLRAELQRWRLRTSCTKRELLSLIGMLIHAGKVVRPGRSFVRRLIDLSTTVSDLHHHIQLRRSGRSDIAWWIAFSNEWNGISLLNPPVPSLSFSTDASGSWGCGGIWLKKWFQVQWNTVWHPLSIAVKELLPVVVAAILWGPCWAGLHVRCFSDNTAVVFAINRRAVRDPLLMRLLRSLFFVEAHFNLRISASHIAGARNTAADLISRNRITEFSVLFPQADRSPTPIPQTVAATLMDLNADWPYQNWSPLLDTIMRRL